MPDQVSPPYSDASPTDQQGPTSWANAGAAATAPGPQQPPAALVKAQNPDRSQAQTQSPTASGAIAPTQIQAPPLVMRPKRSGLAGVLGKIADVLTGTTRPEIYTDQNGDEYVYHANMSRGQQWMRIGAGAFRGAGAGLAAGRGGNPGRAIMAGTDVAREGQQDDKNQEQQMDQKAQTDTLSRANATMLRMNMAEQAWRASRLQIDADEKDAEFSQKRIDFYKNMGGQVLGTAAHPGDLGEVLHINPQLAEDFVKRHLIEPVATVDPSGHQGVTFIKMPNADWRNQVTPSGATFTTWNPATHQLEQHQASDAMTRGEQSDLSSKAQADQLKYFSDIKEQELKTAEAANQRSEADARSKELPGKIAHENAETFKATKEGEKAASETLTGQQQSELTSEAPVNGVRQNYLASLPDSERSLVQAIGEGRKTDISGYAVGRSPQARKIAAEVTTAYPGYDFSRAEAYKKTREAFTTGQESKAINALNTAMEHMQQMYDNASWITTTPLISSYQRATGNQRAIDLKDAQTALVDELGKAYKAGALTIEDKKSWEGRINSWSPKEVTGNAKSFVKLLRGKLDGYDNQWRSGAPPGAVSPIQILSPGAQAAWQHIMADGTAPPTRPPNVPAGATWHPEANNGKGAWTL